MFCPACGNELTPQKVDHMTLHVCDGGCGGVWFDWFDLETFEEQRGTAQTMWTIQRDPKRKPNASTRYCCPHCTSLVMNRRFIEVIDDVMVDECPSCSGIWLNADELDGVREQFEQATPEELNAPLGTDNTSEDENVDAGQLQRDKRFVNVCRFLCQDSHAHTPESTKTI